MAGAGRGGPARGAGARQLSADRSHHRARRNAAHLETLAGLLGFFAAAVLVTTIIAEVTGRPAGLLALVLLLLVVALAATLRARRRLGGPAGPGPGGAGRDRGGPVSR